MIKILFVDDEPLVLEGLQRMLRPMRHEWEMSFAESGAAALELMAATPRDVVVSDMRMPGMDGAQLLAEVTRLHPRTVRLVLSGYADQELIMKSVGLAHQYLSKPCSAEQIMAAIEQACASRDLLTNESLQRLIARMDSLPSLPSLYTQLVSELKSPDASIKRVGEIISLDLGMTAKILQMVNSAFFGLRRRVSNPGDAAMFLGIDTIMSLVLAIHVFSQFNETSVQGFSPQALWAQGMAAGQSAKRIVKAEGQDTKMSEAAFTAGLLHDVGKVVLATSLPEWYGEAFRLEREEHFPFIEAELQVLGATHAEVGAYLLGLWGLPDAVVEAVAYHHRPGKCPSQAFGPLTAVHVADAFAHEAQGEEPSGGCDMEYLAGLGLAGKLDGWRDICREND